MSAKGASGDSLGVLRTITFTPPLVLVVAQRRGFFEAEGLQIENVVTQSSGQLVRGVLDGTQDLGCTNPDNWITYATRDGADLFMFCGGNRGGERTVVVRPEIATAAELRGRALAVDAVDSGLVMILWKVLADQGVDFRGGDPRLVPVGTTALRLASMERGETFAAVTSAAETEQALALGFRPIGRATEHLPDYPGPQWATTRRWAAAREAEMVRFIRAWCAATAWAVEPGNRSAAIASYREACGVSPAVAEESFASVSPTGALDLAGIRRILELRTALGFLQAPAPPPERFYDASYWELAIGRR